MLLTHVSTIRFGHVFPRISPWERGRILQKIRSRAHPPPWLLRHRYPFVLACLPCLFTSFFFRQRYRVSVYTDVNYDSICLSRLFAPSFPSLTPFVSRAVFAVLPYRSATRQATTHDRTRIANLLDTVNRHDCDNISLRWCLNFYKKRLCTI